MLKTIITQSFICLAMLGFSQEEPIDDIDNFEEGVVDGVEEIYVEDAFTGSRIINGHSTTTLEKGSLEVRIEHRFGDFAGVNGGTQQWFGLDNVADIRLAIEYGISNNLMIGLGRSKGSGTPYRSLVDGVLKYRVLQQKRSGMPISLAVSGLATYTYMTKSSDLTSVSSFPKESHRLAYSLQLPISKRFGKRLSLQLTPGFTHRNYVAADDENTLFNIGSAVKFSASSTYAIIVEYYHVLADKTIRAENFNSLGVALEIQTFGHIFTINFTNSKGFGETQFITNTFSDWMEGQFRLGFAIGRYF